jgi:2',3'-cyclic-nucleotide 2'-phosphodiesterase (5'-nucleotidase family)
MLLFALTLLGPACGPKDSPPEPAAQVTAPAGPYDETELITSGRVEDRVSRWPADLVLFYGGEHKGSMETCGCPKNPRGSLARQAAYTHASSTANPDTPHLTVHGGYWLENAISNDGNLRADVPVMNRWMIQGLHAAAFDAVNVTFEDLPGLQELESAPPWAVSAHVIAQEGTPAPARSLVVVKDGLRIGITGITSDDLTFMPTPGYRYADARESATALLQELAPQVDLLVLLAFRSPEAARDIAQAVPELDVVIHSGMHRELYDPARVGDTLWLRSHYQTMRLGELRMTTADGDITAFVDRKIDLDPFVADDPTLAALSRESRGELEKLQAELFATP